jgi:hypothetical protein
MFSCDAFTLLYLALFCTSFAAAAAAGRVHHGALRRCYLANSLIYGLLGLSHGFGVSSAPVIDPAMLWHLPTLPVAASATGLGEMPAYAPPAYWLP